MTGELVSRAYIRTVIPRSSDEIMEYVITELKEECDCSLLSEGDAGDGEQRKRNAVTLPTRLALPHGLGGEWDLEQNLS